jgi:hypothetical protein
MSSFRTRENVNVEALVTDEGTQILDLNTDAFNRVRVSSPISQFEYANEYNKGPLIWAEKVTGAGVATHQPNSSTVLLSTGSDVDGDGIIRQTVQYMRYAPGKSLLPIITFNFRGPQATYTKRAGYFDTDNGIFVECDGTTVNLVIRSKSSGEIVEARVPQADWNMSKLDGTKDYEPTLDMSKVQIFLCDIQWLGVGSVRCGFEIDGKPYMVHKFDHANEVLITYMATANLPIRYEIHNKAGATEAGLMDQICATVITEQGSIDDQSYYDHAVNNGINATSVTTRRAVLSIRPKATLGGKVNRGTIKHEFFEVITGGNNVLWELVYGGTLGGTPDWTSAGDNSLVEFDIAGTTVTGGEVIASGYALTGGGATRGRTEGKTQARYPMGLDVDGLNPRLLSLVVTSVTGTATVNAAIGFKEYY